MVENRPAFRINSGFGYSKPASSSQFSQTGN